MAIYIKLDKDPTTIKKLLEKWFSHSNYTDRRIGVETYTNKKCTIKQCLAERMRSFDDTLECVQTYFPKVTPKDLMHELIILDLKSKDGKQLYPHFYYCASMKRIRIIYYISSSNGWSNPKLSSKYSWRELYEMLGINQPEEIEKYKQKYKIEEYV